MCGKKIISYRLMRSHNGAVAIARRHFNWAKVLARREARTPGGVVIIGPYRRSPPVFGKAKQHNYINIICITIYLFIYIYNYTLVLIYRNS